MVLEPAADLIFDPRRSVTNRLRLPEPSRAFPSLFLPTVFAEG